MKKPRVKWFKTCRGEPFSVECYGASDGTLGAPPIVFAGDYGFRSERDLQRFIDALVKVNEWFAAERKRLAGGKKK